MMEAPADTFFGLHFRPQGPDGDRRPMSARHLTAALNGLEQSAHLVAMMGEGHEIRARARPTQDIRQRFHLHLQTPQEGSYLQPTYFADVNDPSEIPLAAENVMEVLRKAMEAISSGAMSEFERVIHDVKFRAPVIEAFKKMFGAPGDHYGLEIEDRSGRVIAISESAAQTLERIGETKQDDILTRHVATGYIEKIDSEKNKIFLRMPHTGRLLESAYNKKIEQVFIKNSYNLIQIVGTVEVDNNGNPNKILEIRNANEIDASDISIIDVIPEYLKPKDGVPSLIIKVDLTDDKQFYVARSSELAMFKHAPTRAELVDNLEAEMDFLWQQFALLDEGSPCSEEVGEIRRKLKDMFREISE